MKLNTNIRDFILINYNQAALYSKYLSLPYGQILNSIEYRQNIINSHRGDSVASLRFYYKGDKLLMWDFGSNLYRGDIFHAVGIYMNKSSNIHFNEICNEIITNNKIEVVEKSTKDKTSGLITYNVRDYNKYDKLYWSDGNISHNYLKVRGVYPVKTVLYTENLHTSLIYSQIETDPTYVYQLGTFDNVDVFKLYRPHAKDKKDKFKSNKYIPIEGLNELYESEILIITKARKDKFVLESYIQDGYIIKEIYKLVKRLNYPPFVTYPFFKGVYDETYKIKSKYCVINVSSESVLLGYDFVEFLYTKHKKIIINYDYDMTGIINAYVYTKLYNFEARFIGRDASLIFNRIDNDLLKLISSKFETLDLIFNVDDFYDFINTHSGIHEEKDWFELSTTNKNYCKKLINELFS